MTGNTDALNLVLRAMDFAARKHREQRRKDVDTSPYINHPIALARILSEEGGVDDPIVLAAALLHDTIEDTVTSYQELRGEFGTHVADVVAEVTDTKWLGKTARKQIQVSRAATASHRAKLVKIADKIANLRDIISHPPADWTDERKRQYFDWAKSVIDRLRGTNERLERRFDALYRQLPPTLAPSRDPHPGGARRPSGAYASLIVHLNKHESADLALSMSQIERIIQRPLPRSARRYPAFWSPGNHVGRQLLAAGWQAYLRPREQQVMFRRAKPTREGPTLASLVSNVPLARPPDLVLVGCVKSKRQGSHRAATLYTSALFQGRCDYARSTGKPWYVLSAKHGLLAPDDVVEYYDVALKDLPAGERQDWSRRVLEQIDARVGPVQGKVVEIHAGKAYREHGLVQGFADRGAMVTAPLAKLRQGEQLAWYAAQHGARASADRASRAKRATDHSEPVFSMPDDQVRAIVRRLTDEFTRGRFDLSRREGAPVCGWHGIPEIRMAELLRSRGMSDRDLRIRIGSAARAGLTDRSQTRAGFANRCDAASRRPPSGPSRR